MAITLDGINIEIGANIVKFEQAMGKVRTLLGKLDKDFSQKLKNVGQSLSKNVTRPVTQVGKSILSAAGDFEQAMSRLQAQTGAAGQQFAALRKQALDMGRTTKFSAAQSAEALGRLSRAGFDAGQRMGALPGVLELAAAASLTIGEAVDVTSNVLDGFDKKVAELGGVNDVLAKALTSSNTNIVALGEALRAVGPTASKSGQNFEDMVAILAALDDAGIQGGAAGLARSPFPLRGIDYDMGRATFLMDIRASDLTPTSG